MASIQLTVPRLVVLVRALASCCLLLVFVRSSAPVGDGHAAYGLLAACSSVRYEGSMCLLRPAAPRQQGDGPRARTYGAWALHSVLHTPAVWPTVVALRGGLLGGENEDSSAGDDDDDGYNNAGGLDVDDEDADLYNQYSASAGSAADAEDSGDGKERSSAVSGGAGGSAESRAPAEDGRRNKIIRLDVSSDDDGKEQRWLCKVNVALI